MTKRISPRRDMILKTEDALYDIDLNQSEVDDSEASPESHSFESPKRLSAGRLSETPTKSIKTALKNAGEDLMKQESYLESLIGASSNWLYPKYNALAKVRYKIFEKAEEEKDHDKMQLYLDKTEAAMNSAKSYVDNVKSSANLKNKSIIYYNHSQIITALNPKDKTKLQEAKKSIETAIKMIESLEAAQDVGSTILLQDYLYHSTFVLNSLGYREDAKYNYEKAVEKNVERFLQQYTTDFSGEELITFAITRDSHFVLKQLKAKYGGFHYLPKSIKINAHDSEGQTYLSKALEYNSNDLVIDQLLHLGADPLLESMIDDVKCAPLYKALSDGRIQVVISMFDFLQDRFVDIEQDKILASIEALRHEMKNSGELLSNLKAVLKSEYKYVLDYQEDSSEADESAPLMGHSNEDSE